MTKRLQPLLAHWRRRVGQDDVLLNAAAALSLENLDLAEGLGRARAAIDSGQALQTLEAWIAKTQSF